MKAVEFRAEVGADRKLQIPDRLASGIPEGQPVKVILLFPDDSEEQDWSRLTREQFLKGYSDGDAIYDRINSAG